MVEHYYRRRNRPSCSRSNCYEVSARFLRKDNDLARIIAVWISDLVLVCFVNDRVSHARAVCDAADAPESVSMGYNRRRDLGHDHDSGRAF
jgi:hypothetical protein